MAWNIGNYAFFLLAGRVLGPSDYGLAAALLAVIVIASVPCGALQATVSHAVASSEAGKLVYQRVFGAALRASCVGAVGLVALCTLANLVVPEIPLIPVLLTVIAVALLPCLLAALGALQGTNRFAAFSTGFALWGLPRPFFLIPFALAGIGVVGPMVATLAAICVATAYSVVRSNPIRKAPSTIEAPPPDWPGVNASLKSLGAALGGIAVLTNLDVIVAKMALSDTDAGHFAASAVLAKAVLIVPQALSFVLLPRITRRSSRGEESSRLLRAAVATTLATSVAVAAICVPLGEPIVRISFGASYASAAEQLPGFVLASGLLGVLLVLVNHQAGTGRTTYGWTLLPIGALQLTLFAAFHGSASQIIGIDAIVGVLGIVVHEVVMWKRGGALLR